MEQKKDIENLYNLYAEEMYNDLTEEMRDITKQIDKDIERLNRTLTKKQKRILSKIIDLEGNRVEKENKHIFIYAYSIATKIIIESYCK